MFLFILESIGTSELILISLIALVIFGPRKLPQFAKTIGKTMADFRRTTNEFKATWEKEVDFEEEKALLKQDTLSENPKPIAQNIDLNQNLIATPEIREIDQSVFDSSNGSFTNEMSEVKAEKIEIVETKEENIEPEKEETSKRDWL